MSSMARLEQVLKGMKSLQVEGVSPDLLLKMKGVWQKRGTTWDNTMLWAAVTLCFFGFFRSREITVPAASAFDEGAHPGMCPQGGPSSAATHATLTLQQGERDNVWILESIDVNSK